MKWPHQSGGLAFGDINVEEQRWLGGMTTGGYTLNDGVLVKSLVFPGQHLTPRDQ